MIACLFNIIAQLHNNNMKGFANMEFGFVTGWNETNFKLAAEIGFDGVELCVGGPMDPASVSDDDAKKVRDQLAEIGTKTLTLFYSGDIAAADQSAQEQVWKNFRRVMELAPIMGTSTVTTIAWTPAGANRDEMIAFYKKAYTTFAQWAEDLGVRVGIENWYAGGRNIAFSPANWVRMWEEVPSPAIGLEFDPSHLVWQGVDFIAALREHHSRVYAFHAKDTEIFYDILKKQGHLLPGWWRYRIPGWGIIDWREIFMALNDIGYNGSIIVEHEDPVFSGERWAEGLRFGIEELKSHIDPCKR